MIQDGDPLYRRLQASSQAAPEALALVIDDERHSYEDVLVRVDRCAAGLAERGCQAGDAIAVVVPNSIDFVVGVFAAWALGAIAVPLNPKFREDELKHYLVESGPKAILAPERLLEDLARAAEIPVKASRAEDWNATSPRAAAPRSSDGPGVYMFSSGSTGRSKRVTRTQAQLWEEYEALRTTVDLQPSDSILCTIPLFHAHGFCNALLAALLTGARLIVLTREFNARSTVRALVEHRVTIYPAVPFMFKTMSETRFSVPPDLDAIRLLISAGAALPDATSQGFLERFGHPIAQLYGSTETGALTINARRAKDKPRSVGRPLTGYLVEIRDEHGQRLRPSAVGEVWVKTPAMTHRYDGLEEMTAECFVDGFFFTGDLGYQDDDGDLYITDRKKLLINVAGFKVDPLEVEQTLLDHPAVADVVVVGLSHPDYGEEVKAVVVTKPGAAVTEAQLIDHVTPLLAEYKVPKRWEFREEIPRSPLGKVLRKYL